MMNLNQETLEQIAQEAFDHAEGSRRWQRAIAKAKGQLESNPFMHWDGHAHVILSASNEVYEAKFFLQ